MDKIYYKIFKIREGLLKEPTSQRYGYAYELFHEYGSQEEAIEAIKKADRQYEEFVILPMFYYSVKEEK